MYVVVYFKLKYWVAKLSALFFFEYIILSHVVLSICLMYTVVCHHCFDAVESHDENHFFLTF